MENENLSKPSMQKRNFILYTIAIFCSFAVFGLADTVRGTVLPRIQAEFTLTELHLGLILAVNSAGYLFACTITTKVASKISMRYAHILSMALVAVSGLAIFFSPTFLWLLVSFFILNMGFGGVEISVGVLAAKIFTKNTGTMLNLSHFFFGVGSIVSPMVSTAIMAARFSDQISNWRYVYLIALAFAILPIIPALFAKLRKKKEDTKKKSYFALAKKPTVWLIIFILTFGLIGEAGLVSWLVSYLENAHGFAEDKSALFLTLYFVTFTIGRLILGPFIDRIGFINSLAIITFFAGTMITVGVVLGESGAPLIIFAGLGTAPIFPTVMAIIAKLFTDSIESAMTTVMTIIGIMMIPANFLIGAIISQARQIFSLHGQAGISMAFSAGFLVVGIACLMATLFTLILRQRQVKLGTLV